MTKSINTKAAKETEIFLNFCEKFVFTTEFPRNYTYAKKVLGMNHKKIAKVVPVINELQPLFARYKGVPAPGESKKFDQLIEQNEGAKLLANFVFALN